METGTRLCIEKAIVEIASLRKMAIEMEETTKEEIDCFIDSNLSERCAEYEQMNPEDFVLTLLQTKLDINKKARELNISNK